MLALLVPGVGMGGGSGAVAPTGPTDKFRGFHANVGRLMRSAILVAMLVL